MRTNRKKKTFSAKVEEEKHYDFEEVENLKHQLFSKAMNILEEKNVIEVQMIYDSDDDEERIIIDASFMVREEDYPDGLIYGYHTSAGFMSAVAEALLEDKDSDLRRRRSELAQGRSFNRLIADLKGYFDKERVA